MDNQEIRQHSFEVENNRLREFSQRPVKEVKLDTVQTDGWFFGLGDHTVKGYELNSRLRSIQEHLIALNGTNMQAIQEFGQVYKTFEVLDKEYIQHFQTSIEAIKKTSDTNADIIKSLEKVQKELSNAVATQTKTIEALRTVANNKLDKKVHEDLKKEVTKQKQVLESLQKKLGNQQHLQDIDKLWKDCQNNTSAIKVNANTIKSIEIDIKNTRNNLKKEIESLKETVNTMKPFQEKINSYQHLNDIDTIWIGQASNQSQLETLAKENEHLREQVHASQSQLVVLEAKKNTLTDQINVNQEQLVALTSLVTEHQSTVDAVVGKIKIAYWTAGGAIGLALIELLLMITKVM